MASHKSLDVCGCAMPNLCLHLLVLVVHWYHLSALGAFWQLTMCAQPICLKCCELQTKALALHNGGTTRSRRCAAIACLRLRLRLRLRLWLWRLRLLLLTVHCAKSDRRDATTD